MKKVSKKLILILTILLLAIPALYSQSLDITNIRDGAQICVNGTYRITWNVDNQPGFYFTISYYGNNKYGYLIANVYSKTGYVDISVNEPRVTYQALFFFSTKTGVDVAQFNDVTFSMQPVIIKQSPDGNFYKGFPFKLWVKAQGDVAGYQWYKNGIEIPNTNTDTIYFKNTGVDATGIYTCKVKGSVCEDIMSDPFNINIMRGPDIVVQPENIPFVNGRSAGFKAVAHLTPKDAETVKFQWWRDSVHSYWEIINGVEQLLSDTTLVKINDNGKYAGTQSDYLTVNINSYGDRINYYSQVITTWGSTFTTPGKIMDWFDVIMLSRDYQGCEGFDVDIEVKVVGYSYDEVTFQWYKTGGKLLPESEKFTGTRTSRLHIKGVRKTDMGAYYCRVKHKQTGYWKNSAICSVVPEVKPHVIWQNRKWVIKHPSIPDYQDALFVGIIVDNLQQCHYQLFHKDTIVDTAFAWSIRYLPYYTKDDTARKIQKGKFRYAIPSDTGAYVCKFWNDCGITWSDTCYVYWDDEDTVKGTVRPIDDNSDTPISDDENITDTTWEGSLSGTVDDFIIAESRLEAYPNPAISGTTIDWYGLGETDEQVVEIYNSYGAKINDLSAQGISGRGAATFYWNGMDSAGNVVPSGLYFAKVISHGVAKTIAIMIAK